MNNEKIAHDIQKQVVTQNTIKDCSDKNEANDRIKCQEANNTQRNLNVFTRHINGTRDYHRCYIGTKR